MRLPGGFPSSFVMLYDSQNHRMHLAALNTKLCVAHRSGDPGAELGRVAGPLIYECQVYTVKAHYFVVPVQIRTEVLKMLQALPIDLTDEQRKGQMKKSQIGHVVMFLSKPEVENNRSNRRIARVGPAS